MSLLRGFFTLTLYLAIAFGLSSAASLVAQEEAKTAIKEDDKQAKKEKKKAANVEKEGNKEGQKEGKKEETKQDEGTSLKLGSGKLTMTVPAGWETVKPGNNIVEAEFKIPKVEGDENDGRLTMMAASGGSEANIQRWIGQFSQEDGSQTKAKTEEKTIADMKVHVVDIVGSFADAPRGPFGPKVQRDGYRMLAAIVETGTNEYYLKLYGPKKTIAENEKKFEELVDSLKGK